MTPIEGIVAIRKIVGMWLRPEGSKPRDAIANVANVILSVSVPVLIAPLTAQQQVIQQMADTLADVERITFRESGTLTHFQGLVPLKSIDTLEHLDKMIEQACHKPGEWKEGFAAGGSIEGRTFTESFDLEIGKLLQRRDAFLAIAAVNALPELIKRVRDAESEVTELRAKLEVKVSATA